MRLKCVCEIRALSKTSKKTHLEESDLKLCLQQTSSQMENEKFSVKGDTASLSSHNDTGLYQEWGQTSSLC